jgi:hypothetical protein
MLMRLAVGLEPLNALDAAHRAPQSAPHSRTEFGSPIGPATRRSIKRNKELTGASNRKMIASSITGIRLSALVIIWRWTLDIARWNDCVAPDGPQSLPLPARRGEWRPRTFGVLQAGVFASGELQPFSAARDHEVSGGLVIG